jgi:hypothetical protein
MALQGVATMTLGARPSLSAHGGRSTVTLLAGWDADCLGTMVAMF